MTEKRRDVRMRIVFLAWGSLIWEPRDLPLATNWCESGCILPIEFSCISTSRHGALTLVVDPVHEVPVPTQFAISARSNLNQAIRDLRLREGTENKRNIGFVNLLSNSQRTRHESVASTIRTWAGEQHFDAAVWADFPSNFEERVGEVFSVEYAVAYLQRLPQIGQIAAREYIERAPIGLQTPVRQLFTSVHNC